MIRNSIYPSINSENQNSKQNTFGKKYKNVMEETNAFVLVANTHPACRDALLKYLDDPEMIEINNSDSFSVTAN